MGMVSGDRIDADVVDNNLTHDHGSSAGYSTDLTPVKTILLKANLLENTLSAPACVLIFYWNQS